MNLKELDSFKLSDAVKFHEKLNPKLWANNRLRPEVKNQLKKIAEDFIDELGISGLDVDDITVSGSNAAYSYTPHSDLDLHILIDMNKLPNDEVYRELFNAKKTIYNDSHNIKIHGVPIELYVQDKNQPVISLGEYSLLNDKWIKIPSKRRANFDQNATMAKYDKLHTLVKHALKSKDISMVQNVIKKIKQYRQAGLDKGGEFGPENLAYKALRSQGYITNLYNLRDKLHSRELSLNGMYANPRKVADEDYHPNDTPPGPEFKPTMPAGTVKVDVSDVYDWYKLGQHISNMKGLGKHDFGKGPPSAILSFGDEDTEHKYIDYLLKTGLTTTDIDPASHKKIKGQKVDPTYNVNEEVDELPKKVYHITPSKNLKTILAKGLIPQKGERSRKILDEKSAIYCFPDKNSMEDAVMNWLGDEFDEDEALALLEIDTTGLQGQVTDGAEYEIAITSKIPVENIRVLSKDLATPINESLKKTKKIQESSNNKFAWRIRFKRFSDLDALLPERENKVYLMPLDKSALKTYTSLTGKDYDKIKNMPSEVYEVGGDAMVGDMYLINVIFNKLRELKQYKTILDKPINAKNKQDILDDIEKYKQEYLDTRVPLSQYKEGMFKFPEILAEPSQVKKIEDKGVNYDNNTGEIVLTQRKLGEDETLQFAGEKTPAINPYGGLKDRQFRGAINEMPDTSGPVGVQPGGWRIYRPKITEAFDQPYELKWEKSDYGDYDALAKLDDGTYLSIMFNNEYKKNWMVEFYRNNSQQVTGEGDAQRIFATVLHAIQQFIKKKKPTSLFFSAVKEDDPTGSRTKLYDRLVQRFATGLGYTIQKREEPGSNSYKLKRIENTNKGVEEGTIPVYKDPSQFYAGGKKIYKLFRNAFPNLPEHVANDIYNQTSPGTNEIILNAINQGEDPKQVFLNYYSGVSFNFSKDPGTNLTPDQLKKILLNGRWQLKIISVNPADFNEYSRNRMIKRNFGINPDEDPVRIQRQQSTVKGDGTNEPVTIIQTQSGYVLWEGFHRTMSILLLGKNGDDPLKWNKVKLRAWVVTFEKQGVAESASGYSNTTFQIKRRKLNVPALIKAGAIFVTHPHGEQGWETDNKEDWAYSLISLYNVMQGGWPSEAKKYVKPASYKKAEQQINSSAPNLGSDQLVYDGKYNQILWSIKKLGIPDNVAFLDEGQKEVAESASGYIPSNAEKDDPRFKTALTVDIKPDTMKKDAKKFGNKISRAGIPPTLKPNGKR